MAILQEDDDTTLRPAPPVTFTPEEWANSLHDGVLVINPGGGLDPSMLGKEITLKVVVGYPGSRVTDLMLGGCKVQVPNDVLQRMAVSKIVVKEREDGR